MLIPFLALQASLTQHPSRPRPASEVTTLVDRARAARYQQDSALGRYEAVARQRMSAKIGLSRSLGLGPLTPERLAARFESIARVGWDYSRGAWAEVLGARGVVPLLGITEPDGEDADVALVLPYHPGRDELWPIDELRGALPNAGDWIEHPLAAGADSLYAFSLGDSLQIKLPDKSIVRLREIRVRAKRPASRLVVGSLWVDVATGNLVRAAYRPSVPMDLWPLMEREIGRDDRDKVKKLGPFTGIVREVVVEHGLYEGRFWLPRTRIASAEGTARGGRVSIEIEQTFEYRGVSAIPAGVVAARETTTVDIDPRDGRARRPTWYGIQATGTSCRRTGDTTTARWSADSILANDRAALMISDGIRYRVLRPCDHNLLATSPLLPKSIYGDGEELFPETDFRLLQREAEQALSLSRQAEWNPQRPTVHFGLENGLLRYNRIEGLSAGVLGDRELGKGYTAAGSVRIGVADLQVNGELSMRRSNARTDLSGTAYRRLAAANEWEDPLGIGASVSALVFGRDDGYYYRTLGAELTGTHRSATEGPAIAWRIFAEQEDSARVRTQWSLAKSLNGDGFAPNIQARAGFYSGASFGTGFAWGSNPRGTRLTGGARIEGAGGESSFGRTWAELSVSRGLFRSAQASLTASAGTSAGDVPAQRLWYLGGAHTVRGHAPGAAVGDSYWFGRAELASGHPLVRPSVFGDLGWAGPRAAWGTGKPLSAIGAGMTFLEGLVRLDVARGLDRGAGWRADFYLEAR